MIRHSLILVAAVSLGFAPAPVYRPKPETKQDDMQRMVGVWESVPATKGYTMDIWSGRMVYNGTNSYALTLDPSARPPAFDISGNPGAAQGRMFTGIYKLEGDTLTLAYRESKLGRPADFQQGIVEVYKRKKR